MSHGVRQNPITQSAVEQPAPVAVSAGVEQAMAVAMRGCDELLVAQEFINKLVRSEKTQKPLRIKLGLDPTAPICTLAIPSCPISCASYKIWDTP